MNSPDVVIAGAGIIGVSLALELRGRGASVLILERGEPGQEASSAAAGMLAAFAPETPELLKPLARESARIYPEFIHMVQNASGSSTDFRRQGTVALGKVQTAAPEYHEISEQALKQLEPSIVTNGLPAHLVAEASVDPVLLMRAVVKAAERAGIEIRSEAELVDARPRGEDIQAVTSHETISCRALVNCCGAWSGMPVRPRKGQMLYVQPPKSFQFERVVHAPDAYIVPRSSGNVLIGATVEDVGFDKTVEDLAIQTLHRAAVRFVPALASATIIQTWAGLRPGTPDNLPIMGQTAPGMFIASGHYRNGILLAPITAKIMADVVTGRQPAFDLSPFSPARFKREKLHSLRG